MEVKNLKTEILKILKENIVSYKSEFYNYYLKQLKKITEIDLELRPIKYTRGVYCKTFEADIYYTRKKSYNENTESGNSLHVERGIHLKVPVVQKRSSAKQMEKFAIEMIAPKCKWFIMEDSTRDTRLEYKLRDEAEKIAKEKYCENNREDIYNFGIEVDKVIPRLESFSSSVEDKEEKEAIVILAKVKLPNAKDAYMLVGVAEKEDDSITNFVVIGDSIYSIRRVGQSFKYSINYDYIEAPYQYWGAKGIKGIIFDSEGESCILTKKLFKGYC